MDNNNVSNNKINIINMRKFNHKEIAEIIATIVYVAGFLAMFAFTIVTAINN